MNGHLKGLGSVMANGGPKANLAPKAKMGEAIGLKMPSSVSMVKTFPRNNAQMRQDKGSKC